jgi:hypothetical protein
MDVTTLALVAVLSYRAGSIVQGKRDGHIFDTMRGLTRKARWYSREPKPEPKPEVVAPTQSVPVTVAPAPLDGPGIRNQTGEYL